MIDRDASLCVAKSGSSRRESARFHSPWQAGFAKGLNLLPDFQRHAFGNAPEARGWLGERDEIGDFGGAFLAVACGQPAAAVEPASLLAAGRSAGGAWWWRVGGGPGGPHGRRIYEF